MYIKKKKKFNLSENLVTDESKYINRRKFITGLSSLLILNNTKSLFAKSNNKEMFINIDRPLTELEVLTKYNNFFEFGTTKQIWKGAQRLITDDWKINVKGGKYDGKELDYKDLIKKFDLEERIYKFRCVETWSMVVPWYGFELAELIKFLEPNSNTKYVAFKTFFYPKVAQNQKQNWYPWPYQEIITLEEAKNKLSFVATGIYGKELPKQNGAPIRLVFPWKYGFKSIKSIVEIQFLEKKQKSFWESIAPEEYGFWANVNPAVAHKRWSQEFEKDIGTGKRHPTKIFNGYEEWVKYLYSDLNNKKLFF
jgi:methionine sulfoxide reductase catalytic subunit